MAKKPTYEELEKKVQELEKQGEKLKIADDSLGKSEERFRAIVESTTDCILVWDREYNYIYANQAAIDHVGTTRDKVIGKNIRDGLGHIPEFMDLWKSRIDEIFATGWPMRVEDKIPVGDRVVYSESVLSPILDPDAKMFAVGVVYRDVTERKEAEHALKTSQQRLTHLAQIINFLPDATFVIDTEGKVIAWNQAIEHITGIKAKEMLGKGNYEYAIPFYGERRPVLIDIVGKWDKGIEKKYQYIKKEGESLVSETYDPLVKHGGFLWNKASLLYDHNGEVIGAIESIRDITDRKVAEEALRKSEAVLWRLMDKLDDIIWTLDLDLRTTYVSPSIEKKLGFTPEERMAQDPDEQITPTSYSRMTELLMKELEQEQRAGVDPDRKLRMEVEYCHKNGSTLWFENIVSGLRDEKGVLFGIHGVSRDITHRKQAEEELRESEERYRSMMEAMIEPIYIRSPDFRVEYMNLAMIRRTGRDATGEFCFKALHDLDEKCSWCISDKAQQDEYIESEIVSPKDNRSYYISQSPIAHGDGSVSQLTVFRDITDLRKLETQLQQAQKMEAIGTLAGGIAHDFNNILGGIMGYAELAKMKLPEESKVIAELDKMIKSSKRAADLVKQILTVSRQHKEEQKPVQVRYIVKEILNLLRATLPTTIEIREDLAKDTGIVNADPSQMHQVIMNLGTNAGHAMEENGGMLEVGLANVELDGLSASEHLDLDAGSYLRLTVRDTGHGMTSEIMKRIFDPYFTTKDTGEGTGLGLSVAQGIVKAHGGTITVYSEPGKGTTFDVYLPIIREAEKPEKESEELLPTGSERILFIDDEPLLVDIGSQMLERLGYGVVTKTNSTEGLELFRAEPDRFDLVITDMTMPHITGDKLAQELLKIRPDIPIILCTGHSKRISEEKAKGMGIKAFVMKPLAIRELAITVRKALN